jgi:hypothetical protein
MAVDCSAFRSLELCQSVTPDLITELHDGWYFADETNCYEGNGPYLDRAKAQHALNAYAAELYGEVFADSGNRIVISNCISIMGK